MSLTKISAGNFQSHFVTEALPGLYCDQIFCDVTLVSEDEKYFSAHRNILSSVSPVLRRILLGLPREQFPVIFLKDVKGEHLESLLHFIYNGQMDLKQENINKVSQLLQEFELDKVFQIKNSIITEEDSKEDTEEDKEKIKEVTRNSHIDLLTEKFKIREIDVTTHVVEPETIEEKVTEPLEKEERLKYFMKTEERSEHNVEEEEEMVDKRLE